MALKIIIENDQNELFPHENDGNLVTFGRAASNDIVLEERNISRHHFQLELVENRIIIEDMDSYNATYVNDTKVAKPTEIYVGDIISVGDYKIYLEQDKDDKLKTTKSITMEEEIAEEDLMLATTGLIGGRNFMLKGAETVIGSHAGADIFLPDMPEVLAKIIFDGNIRLLIGVENENISINVNDMVVDSIDLRSGDIVEFDKYKFEFIEKGNEYNSFPFLLKAQEERKNQLLKDIDEKKIQSLHSKDDEEENTEITSQIQHKKGFLKENKALKIIIIVLAVAIMITVAVVGLAFSMNNENAPENESLYEDDIHE
ncbi:MAG: FHA domain-containing protein [bacterium]